MADDPLAPADGHGRSRDQIRCISRAAAVFQVKAEDMPASAIATEMAPNGSLRTSIANLANSGGVYIIVSSKGSTADPALKRRRNAMLKAVEGLVHANALALAGLFYEFRNFLVRPIPAQRLT